MFQEFLNFSSHAKAELTQSASPKQMLSNSQVNTMTLEELLERRQQVKECLGPLVEKSKELAVQSKKRAENYADLSLQMISKRENKYSKLEMSDKDRNQFISKMKGYEAEKNALLDEECKLYQELDAERRRVEKANNEIKKWFWVPGYNIYLCADAQEVYSKYIKKIDFVNQQKKQLQNSMDALNRQINEASASVDNIEREINQYTESIALLARKISYYNASVFQFNEFYHQYSLLYESIDTTSDMSSILQAVEKANEVIIELSQRETEIQKQFAEEMKAIDSIIAFTYRGNALYRGQRLYCGEYIASLNKRFIAVLTCDGRFIVRNTSQEIAVVSEGVQEIVFDQEGMVHFDVHNMTQRNAEILIMQNDGNLVLYDSRYKPLWATNTWKYGKIDSKPFPILHLTYEGVYRIASQNSMYFDIADHSFNNGAKLQLYCDNRADNQMFRFEKMENDTYKITALHSSKCLTVYNEKLADEVPIIQNDYCGKQNQLFWVLPSKDGFVKFVAVHSSKVLDVKGGNFRNLTPIQQYFENGTKAQTFKLLKVDGKC